MLQLKVSPPVPLPCPMVACPPHTVPYDTGNSTNHCPDWGCHQCPVYMPQQCDGLELIELDNYGCETYHCVNICPLHICPEHWRTIGTGKDENGCDKFECIPLCPMYSITPCNGEVIVSVDENGCEGYRCKESPCPAHYVLCMDGFHPVTSVNDDGCDVTVCEPAPIACEMVACQYNFRAEVTGQDDGGCDIYECVPICPMVSIGDCPGTIEINVDENGCTFPVCIPPLCDKRLTICPAGMDAISFLNGNGCHQVECMCPPIPAIWCPNGNIIDENNCMTGKCEPCGAIDRKYCEHGRVMDDAGCQTNECQCPPLRTRQHCPNGRVLDNHGCETDQCLPTLTPCELSLTLCAPGMEPIIETDEDGCDQTQCLCPAINRKYCPHGRVLDERNGCETNECACPPMGSFCAFEGRWPRGCPAPRLGCRSTIGDDSRRCQRCVGRAMRKGSPRPWAEKLCMRRNKCNDEAMPIADDHPILGR